MRSGRHLLQTAGEIADQITADLPQPRALRNSQRRHHPYEKHQSLYSGPHTSMYESDDEDGSGHGRLTQDENFDPTRDQGYYNSTTPLSRRVSRHSSTPRSPLSPLQQSSISQSPGTPTHYGPDGILALIQNQQRLLQSVVDTQKEMQTKQSRFDAMLQEILTAKSTSSSTDSAMDRGRKMRISRDLTRKVAAIYSTLDPGFNKSEGSTSAHNSCVKKKIVDEICKLPESKYKEEEVKAAVQRKYESIRRQWMFVMELTKQSSTSKRYRARRKRKFENRTLVVQPHERKRWSELIVDDMSEESDDTSNPNNLIIHKFQWCSQEFNDLKDELDKRYLEKTKKEGILVARKTRMEGSPSMASPRDGAPAWIIDEEWNADA